MKLYTEEQLRTAFIAGMEFIAVHPLKYEQDANEYINSITPIELPSDEDLLVPYPTEEDGKFENGNEIKCWMNGWEKGYVELHNIISGKIKGDK